MARFNKYDFYERSVQTPESHVQMLEQFYEDINGKKPRALREDFCGTFSISCEWVKRHSENTALAIDLDPEPLAYGKRTHLTKLDRAQRARLKPVRQDVRTVTRPGVDLIVAGNFSFNIFKTREALREYLSYCCRSLKKGGMIVLEAAGGPGMIEPVKERKPVFKNGKREFSYIWDQKSFNPITHDAFYAIHFEMADGTKHKDVFTYDWRLWTLPELQELLREAGFREAHVFWETSHRGRGTGEFKRMEKADNAYAWIAHVVGVR